VQGVPETLAAFVLPGRRKRVLALCESNNGIRKLRATLPHFDGFDGKYAERLPADQQTAAAIAARLRALGAPELCAVFSENLDNDAASASLHRSLEQIVGSGSASLVVCIPGLLAYYEGEEPHDRYVLRRS
jgi:hypothetical protein